MKTQAYIEIEVKKEEHAYRFLMPVGASLGEAFDSAIAVSNEILRLAQEQMQKSAPSKEENPSEKIVPMNDK